MMANSYLFVSVMSTEKSRKKYKPQMNADKRRSAFFRVHLRLT